jgi:hypothetical protein
MALVKLGGLAQDVRGSLNGNVFSRNRGGAYVRTKVSPVQPQTSFQQKVRAIFKAVAQMWATTLDAGQRAAWDAWAAVHPFVNVFGDSIILSGVAAFEAVNARLGQIGEDYIGDPPETWSVEDLGPVDVDGGVDGDTLSMKATPTRVLTGDETLFIYGTAPLVGGRSAQRRDFKLVNLVGLTGYASAAQFGPDMQLRLPGIPFYGQDIVVVQVAAINKTTGAISQGVRVEVQLIEEV